LNQCAHGEGRVDTSAELGVEVIVCSAEEGCQTVTLDHGLLNNIKVGLKTVSMKSLNPSDRHTLT
jgi:hypothetical protein